MSEDLGLDGETRAVVEERKIERVGEEVGLIGAREFGTRCERGVGGCCCARGVGGWAN